MFFIFFSVKIVSTQNTNIYSFYIFIKSSYHLNVQNHKLILYLDIQYNIIFYYFLKKCHKNIINVQYKNNYKVEIEKSSNKVFSKTYVCSLFFFSSGRRRGFSQTLRGIFHQ